MGTCGSSPTSPSNKHHQPGSPPPIRLDHPFDESVGETSLSTSPVLALEKAATRPKAVLALKKATSAVEVPAESIEADALPRASLAQFPKQSQVPSGGRMTEANAAAADVSMHTHENGILAALVGLKQRVGADFFRPLETELERVLQEAAAHREYEVSIDTELLSLSTRNDPDRNLLIVRTLNVVPGADVACLFSLTHDTAFRAKWEAQFMSRVKKVTRVPSKGDDTWLLQYPGQFVVKGREFLDRRVTHSDPERKLFVWLSGAANSTAVPKNKGFVRGETVFQVNLVYQVPGGAAHLMILLADPKGDIPSSLINSQTKSFAKKWHNALTKAYAKHARGEDPSTLHSSTCCSCFGAVPTGTGSQQAQGPNSCCESTVLGSSFVTPL